MVPKYWYINALNFWVWVLVWFFSDFRTYNWTITLISGNMAQGVGSQGTQWQTGCPMNSFLSQRKETSDYLLEKNKNKTQTPQKPVLFQGKPEFQVTCHMCNMWEYVLCSALNTEFTFFSWLWTSLSFPNYCFSIFWSQTSQLLRDSVYLLESCKISVRLSSFHVFYFCRIQKKAFHCP